MKTIKVALLALALSALTSCGPTSYVLRGNYPISNAVETNASYDAVWNNVIDFFAMNNLPIAVLEKDSGIIVASKVNIGESLVTMEDENGRALNNSAWFIMPYLNKFNGWKCVGNKTTCSFNVRVRKTDNGTYVSVNLGGIQGIRILEWINMMTFQKSLQDMPSKEQCVSTGKFEKDLLNMFK